jgi:DNA-binding GntR family transcriptional regulator
MLDGDARRMPTEDLVGAGSAFHETLIRMSGNMMYFQALERANQLRRLMEYRLNVNRQRLAVQCTEHLHILDLIERADNLEAAHFMRRHLSGALAAKSPVAQSIPHGI